jgi:hypothetical protein
MAEQTYNGWRNVETWRVQLHLANDEGEAFHMLNHARCRISSPQFENVTGEPVPKKYPGETMADYVAEYVTLSALAQLTNRGPETWYVFANDTVDTALERVDWEAIAEHWLSAARQEVAAQVAGRARTHAVGEQGAARG